MSEHFPAPIPDARIDVHTDYAGLDRIVSVQL